VASGHIAVGFDGSEGSSTAVRWAAVEARRRNLTLRIVTAFGPDYIFTTDEECRSFTEKVADKALGEAREAAPGVAVEHRGYRDLPASALREESKTAELLVVGSRGRGGFAGLLLGSVSRQCAHRSQCPVVVVRPSESGGSAAATGSPAPDQARPPDPAQSGARRIVVGVDGSPSSNAALLWAADEAASTRSQLKLFHTWEWMTSAGWAMIPTDFDPRHDAQTVLDRAIAPVLTTHPDLEISAVVAEGQAAEVLANASTGAELLVVGSRGHGEVSGMLLGSVSDYCITHAHCPVLVMRGAGAGADAPARH
jgi:nucleotide-binding universal stress UspA family protein